MRATEKDCMYVTTSLVFNAAAAAAATASQTHPHDYRQDYSGTVETEKNQEMKMLANFEYLDNSAK